MNFITYNLLSGEITRGDGSCQAEALDAQAQVGEGVLEATGNRRTHYVSGGVLVAYTEAQRIAKANRPLYAGPWDNTTMTWTDPRTLDQIKAARKAVIDAERATRTLEPITYAGASFDADDVAMRNVSGWQTQLAAGASLPPGFVWRDADNADHPADAAFINGLGAAITLRGTMLYAQSWALKAAIDAATTKAEVGAVTWPT